MDIDLQKILDRDPVMEVEAAIGRKIETGGPAPDPAGPGLLAHAMAVNRTKRAALAALDDTHWGTTPAEYLRIAAEVGFREVLRLPFHSAHWKCDDTFHVLWRDDGVLLRFDTFQGGINDGKFLYNWRPDEQWLADGRPGRILSSNYWVYAGADRADLDAARPDYGNHPAFEAWNERFLRGAVLVGDHDAREALRHHLAGLEAYGAFVAPWQPEPRFGVRHWLLHYEDYRDIAAVECADERAARYEVISRLRWAMLPAAVFAACAVPTDPTTRTP